MSTKTITATTKAWLNGHSGPEALMKGPDEAVEALSFCCFDMRDAGWVFVGEATITVTVPDEQTLVEQKVESLKAEKQKTLAEAQARATEIESQIQKLLAISYTPEAA